LFRERVSERPAYKRSTLSGQVPYGPPKLIYHYITIKEQFEQTQIPQTIEEAVEAFMDYKNEQALAFLRNNPEEKDKNRIILQNKLRRDFVISPLVFFI